MRCAYIGNFSVPFSTESHVGQALEAVDVEVVRHQENDVDWRTLHEQVADCAFVLWTTTADYAPPRTFNAQRKFLANSPVPVVGYHLDRWWGLNREHRVRESPFFQANLVVTADGGHEDRWNEAGINHRWMPPGVSEFECGGGTPRPEFTSPIVFVGSHQGGYHQEWEHRDQLVRFLRKNYRDACQFWPRPGEHAIRGEQLRDLYASVQVVVGDSCLAGNATYYVSDRMPETLGRGGFLLHPAVVGITDGKMYTDGEHLRTWRVGDWDALRYLIDHYLACPDEARQIAEQGRAFTLANHTYTTRMRQLLSLLEAEGLL